MRKETLILIIIIIIIIIGVFQPLIWYIIFQSFYNVNNVGWQMVCFFSAVISIVACVIILYAYVQVLVIKNDQL